MNIVYYVEYYDYYYYYCYEMSNTQYSIKHILKFIFNNNNHFCAYIFFVHFQKHNAKAIHYVKTCLFMSNHCERVSKTSKIIKPCHKLS